MTGRLSCQHSAYNFNNDFRKITGVLFIDTELLLNVDLRAFTQIFTGHFRDFAEQNNAVPFHLLFHLSRLLDTSVFRHGHL